MMCFLFDLMGLFSEIKLDRRNSFHWMTAVLLFMLGVPFGVYLLAHFFYMIGMLS
jgi:hypothetical protein